MKIKLILNNIILGLVFVLVGCFSDGGIDEALESEGSTMALEEEVLGSGNNEEILDDFNDNQVTDLEGNALAQESNNIEDEIFEQDQQEDQENTDNNQENYNNENTEEDQNFQNDQEQNMQFNQDNQNQQNDYEQEEQNIQQNQVQQEQEQYSQEDNLDQGLAKDDVSQSLSNRVAPSINIPVRFIKKDNTPVFDGQKQKLSFVYAKGEPILVNSIDGEWAEIIPGKIYVRSSDLVDKIARERTRNYMQPSVSTTPDG